MLRFEPTLWLAQGFIAVFRVYARGVEVFGTGRERQRARLLREQMAEIDCISRSAQEQIKQGNIEQGFEQLESFMERNGNTEESQSFRDSRLNLQAMREESEVLKNIRDSAGEDTETAIFGYRQYIKNHPGSQLAFTSLGAALRDAGRLEESLAAHRHVLQIKQEMEQGSASNAVTHIAIADVLREMGRLDDAIIVYREIVDDDSGDSLSTILHGRAYLHLGDVFKLQGRKREARAAWKQAVKLDQTGTIRAEVSKRLKG